MEKKCFSNSASNKTSEEAAAAIVPPRNHASRVLSHEFLVASAKIHCCENDKTCADKKKPIQSHRTIHCRNCNAGYTITAVAGAEPKHTFTPHELFCKFAK
jgi:hypothetical protein